ncbi:uncharacterized protein LOC126572718 [Anopheles aquasalis]|uniref:uncharacterized protein LOC126572718 n=1 Tax=Anopheles aquasalis TaxID=42839 RepID=UPI00215A1B60|nr:uncharacterized protein LOC126572718 [Anopheles aquasalis]
MAHPTIRFHSEQQTNELFSEPIHFPLVIGTEQFIVTQQDERIICDRRNWFLTKWQAAVAVPQTQAPTAVDGNQQVLCNEIRNINAQNNRKSCVFCFHYDKQTTTDDLPYYQRLDELSRPEVKIVKHVHFHVEPTTKNKAVNTIWEWPVPMDWDDTSSSGEETS